jgi:hypothetical protein
LVLIGLPQATGIPGVEIRFFPRTTSFYKLHFFG